MTLGLATIVLAVNGVHSFTLAFLCNLHRGPQCDQIGLYSCLNHTSCIDKHKIVASQQCDHVSSHQIPDSCTALRGMGACCCGIQMYVDVVLSKLWPKSHRAHKRRQGQTDPDSAGGTYAGTIITMKNIADSERLLVCQQMAENVTHI